MSYYEQPGRTTTIDKDGKQLITVTFIGSEQAPEPSGITGTLRSKTVTKDVAGQVRTQYQYETDAGSDPGVGFQAVQVEVVSAVRTVPIEAHPNFGGEGRGSFVTAAGKKIIKDAVSVPDKKFSDIEDQIRESGSKTDRARSLYGYLMDGITSYYEPSLVIRKTYQASSPPSAGQVGKIANPGVSVPGVPKKATFLLVNVSSRGQSGAYTVTEEYEMSGESGWDTFLYGP
ncbi:hypothetical protein EBZ39_04240 [bacterium]|nr:hypothetical protein [bacterium]